MMKKSFIILFAALVIFTGCYPIPDPVEEPFDPSATTLTEDVWTAGYLGTADEEQWFKFTASANLHFVHFGAFNNKLRVQFYNSDGNPIGSVKDIEDFYSSVKYHSYSSFNAEEEYYVKVQRGDFYSNAVCKYNIAFNKNETPPVTIELPSNAIELTVDIPADGNIPTSDGKEWFKFKATAVTQYIHVIFGGLTEVEVQLYKVKDGIFGDPLGGSKRLSDNDKNYVKQTLTVGDEYYIKITPYNSYRQGTYQIVFNTLFISPTFDITTLNADTWANDELKTDKGNWFVFTANNASQYIHVDFVSLDSFRGLYIIVYDENGDMVGSGETLRSSTKYISRSLNVSKNYYIKITPYYDNYLGTYKIGFTTSTTPPALPTP
jgi:hypothetical protein